MKSQGIVRFTGIEDVQAGALPEDIQQLFLSDAQSKARIENEDARAAQTADNMDDVV